MPTKRKAKRQPNVIPRLTEDEIKDFVRGFLAGHMTTSATVEQNLLQVVFMPIGFGYFSGWTKKELEQVGLIYADSTKDTNCRWGINGHPIYASCRIMHREDWAVAKATIMREQGQKTDIKLEKAVRAKKA